MGWKIGEILVKKSLLTWIELEQTLAEQKKTGKYTGEILIEKKLVPELFFYQALAEQYHMRFVDLRRIKINEEAVRLIPSELAREHRFFPIECRNADFIIGISNPLAPWPKREIAELTQNQNIQTVLCLASRIEEALDEYYGYPQAAIPAN